MLLQDKVVIVHGGGGAIGGACARAFAQEGARVFLTGRTADPLRRVMDDIIAAGGRASFDVLDVLDTAATRRHADAVAAQAGGIDVSLNAIGVFHVQGIGFLDLPLDDYRHPVDAYTRANFNTAQAAARHMARQGSGVLLTLSTPGARLSGAGFLGNGVASAAVEAFSRLLAGELGEHGIRVICLRPDAIPEAVATSHSGKVFAAAAGDMGISIDAMLAGRAASATLLKRLPTLAQVAGFAVFAASDRAGAMTGAIANLSCGSLVD